MAGTGVGVGGSGMLRTRRRDNSVKPNRKLDRKSSRGMIYENEELRLRTIHINAEVEQGKDRGTGNGKRRKRRRSLRQLAWIYWRAERKRKVATMSEDRSEMWSLRKDFAISRLGRLKHVREVFRILMIKCLCQLIATIDSTKKDILMYDFVRFCKSYIFFLILIIEVSIRNIIAKLIPGYVCKQLSKLIL